MLPRTAAFDAAVIGSHAVRSRIEVLDPTGAVLGQLDPTSWRVTGDRSATVRRTCQFTLPGSLAEITAPLGLDPTELLPFGPEVRILRGIELGGGNVELLPLGIFRLVDVNPEVSGAGRFVQFTGSDRAERLDRKLIAPYAAPLNTNYGDAIIGLLTQVWTGAAQTPSAPPFAFTETDHLTPSLMVGEQTAAMSEAVNWAQSCGKELYLDVYGNVVFADLPDINSPAEWSFADGDGDTRIRLAARYSSADSPNYIVVNGTNSGLQTPVRGVAIAQDPLSWLDVNGVFATVPAWFDSPYVTTNEAAAAEAQSRLAKVLAGTETLVIDAVPNPAMTEGTVVSVTSADLGLFQRPYIVNQTDLQGAPDQAMTLTVGRG